MGAEGLVVSQADSRGYFKQCEEGQTDVQEDEASCTESFLLSVVTGLLCVVLDILLSSFGNQLWRAFCNTMQN